ncbi:hypothetical protein D3C86_2141090 [compost metagenome]
MEQRDLGALVPGDHAGVGDQVAAAAQRAPGGGVARGLAELGTYDIRLAHQSTSSITGIR